MQTFVPFADYRKTAEHLDMKRLGKQRVETFQVMGGLMRAKLVTKDKTGTRTARRMSTVDGERVWREVIVDVYTERAPEDWEVIPRLTANGRTWGDHLIGKMWAGHEYALLEYQRATCDVWTERGGKNDTCFPKSAALLHKKLKQTEENSAPPEWLGREDVHSSHRAALLFKNFEYYSQFGWDEEPVYDYVWPVK